MARAQLRLDPFGARRAYATRIIFFSNRERGIEDPPGAEEVLSEGWDFPREAGMVAALMAMDWVALDSGNLAEADSLTRLAMARVARPTDWPALLFHRAIVCALTGQVTELEAVLRRYEQLPMWHRPVPPPVASETHVHVNELLRRVVGRDLPTPEYLVSRVSAIPWDDGNFAPRINFYGWLQESVDELRAGRRHIARTCLERAITLLPSYSLAPLTLARATAEELGELRELIGDHPEAGRLRIDLANTYTPVEREVVTTLSEREVEVLALLRAGATNQEMARKLFVSVNTVKFHRANLMRKLGARNRDEALAAAASLGV